MENIEVGGKFDSITSFLDLLKVWCDSGYHPVIIRHFCALFGNISSENQERFRFRRVVFACIHNDNSDRHIIDPAGESNGENTLTTNNSCGMHVTLKFDDKSNQLRIISLETRHNHEISNEEYSHFLGSVPNPYEHVDFEFPYEANQSAAYLSDHQVRLQRITEYAERCPEQINHQKMAYDFNWLLNSQDSNQSDVDVMVEDNSESLKPGKSVGNSCQGIWGYKRRKRNATEGESNAFLDDTSVSDSIFPNHSSADFTQLPQRDSRCDQGELLKVILDKLIHVEGKQDEFQATLARIESMQTDLDKKIVGVEENQNSLLNSFEKMTSSQMNIMSSVTLNGSKITDGLLQAGIHHRDTNAKLCAVKKGQEEQQRKVNLLIKKQEELTRNMSSFSRFVMQRSKTRHISQNIPPARRRPLFDGGSDNPGQEHYNPALIPGHSCIQKDAAPGIETQSTNVLKDQCIVTDKSTGLRFSGSRLDIGTIENPVYVSQENYSKILEHVKCGRTFARKLLQQVFRPDELAAANYSGANYKVQLDMHKLQAIEAHVLKVFPSTKQSDMKESINSACRFHRRRLKRLSNEVYGLEGVNEHSDLL